MFFLFTVLVAAVDRLYITIYKGVAVLFANKNYFVLCLFLFVAGISFSSVSYSAETGESSADVGPVVAKFEVVYTDSSGLKWSKKLDGTYTNGCIGTNGDLDFNACSVKTLPNGEELVGDDSAAVQACLNAGGRLPTVNEYIRLRADFPRYEDIFTTFTDMRGRYFWSTSLDHGDKGNARGFYGSSGISYYYVRGYDGSVRCVGR